MVLLFWVKFSGYSNLTFFRAGGLRWSQVVCSGLRVVSGGLYWPKSGLEWSKNGLRWLLIEYILKLRPDKVVARSLASLRSRCFFAKSIS